MSEPTPHDFPNEGDRDLEAGEVVGEYQIESQIGKGGFGTVFKAVHPVIGKVVAIKVLARKFSVDPEMVSRFVAEARAVNQIRHHNIIDIFSFGQLADGRHYYVMEYLDGEPLDARLSRDGRIALVDALPILHSIARALDAAHGKGIAHRDLKPENVFLVADPDGAWPKLLDFGIAKLMTSDDGQKFKTQTGIAVGTPYYMSPEQCRGKDVDHRTDYYAFGVVAYQMLTGTLPIDGDDHLTVMMGQLSKEPAPPSSINPDLPPGVDDVIAWLIKKDPSERPPKLVAATLRLAEVTKQSGIAVQSAMFDSMTRSTTTPSLRAAVRAPAESMILERPAARPRWPYVAAVGAVVVAAVVMFVALSSHEPASRPVAPVAPTPAAPTAPVARPTAPAASAAVPAPAESIPAPSPAPPPVPTITITIDGTPADTEVLLGETSIAHVPGQVTLDRGTAPIHVTLRHPGFAPLRQVIVPDHEQTLHLKLHHATAHHAGATDPGADSHGIENPFGQ